MKIFTYCFVSLLVVCCGAKKTITNSSMEESNKKFVGIIHVNEDGCPWYIAIPDSLNPGATLDFSRIYPVNLKDGMKKKGLKVEFTYTLSRAMNPVGCTADAVVQLDTITVIP
ncbi:MAG: hypothetical protein EBS17_00395 [Flavobacteriia bacterium]|nr:hypothetical protein [Flavobacteriia bacterium]